MLNQIPNLRAVLSLPAPDRLQFCDHLTCKFTCIFNGFSQVTDLTRIKVRQSSAKVKKLTKRSPLDDAYPQDVDPIFRHLLLNIF